MVNHIEAEILIKNKPPQTIKRSCAGDTEDEIRANLMHLDYLLINGVKERNYTVGKITVIGKLGLDTNPQSSDIPQ